MKQTRGNVADVLGNVPSVSVDLEGNVSLRGNENVRILINGKPSGLVGISGPQGLQNLPAESIDKVEVITSPSARYGAEGNAGIINVILRKDNLNGLNGNFVLNAGIPERNSGSININYRTNRLNIFSTNSSGWLLKTPPGDKALHLIPSLHQYVERYLVRPINPVLITE